MTYGIKLKIDNGATVENWVYIVEASNAFEASDKAFKYFSKHSSSDESIVNSELDITELKDTDVLYAVHTV